MPLTRSTFAAALRMHRERLGLTQAEAAQLLGVSPRAIWKWENEEGNCLTVTMEGVIARLKFAQVKAK